VTTPTTTQVAAPDDSSARLAVSNVLIEAIEKLNEGSRCLLVRKDVFSEPAARVAAVLAGTIVFNDHNPDGEWTEERDGAIRDMLKHLGIAAPLKPEEIEAGLTYLRSVFNDENHKASPGRSEAAKFLAWAKSLSVGA